MLSDEEVQSFTDSVNAGLTTQFLFTGTFPQTYEETRGKWKREKESGDVLFGIWTVMVVATDADDKVVGMIDAGRFIGVCGLHSYRSIYRSYELRIILHDPQALGKGIGTEATKLLTHYAFFRLNAGRVWLGCSEANVGAWKCYEKCGYVLEGSLRNEIYTNGSYHNARRYSVLRSEWETLSKVWSKEGTIRISSEQEHA